MCCPLYAYICYTHIYMESLSLTLSLPASLYIYMYVSTVPYEFVYL